MPTELLALPPSYTLVGLYRLLTDPSIREPVLAKVKHAAVRGAVVGAAYATLGWGFMSWIVKRWIVKGRVGERVTLGHGSVSMNIDLVLCKLKGPGEFMLPLTTSLPQTPTCSSLSPRSARS